MFLFFLDCGCITAQRFPRKYIMLNHAPYSSLGRKLSCPEYVGVQHLWWFEYCILAGSGASYQLTACLCFPPQRPNADRALTTITRELNSVELSTARASGGNAVYSRSLHRHLEAWRSPHRQRPADSHLGIDSFLNKARSVKSIPLHSVEMSAADCRMPRRRALAPQKNAVAI
jgi:hypothetical protein